MSQPDRGADRELRAVILAAGAGTGAASTESVMLRTLAGRPVVDYVAEIAQATVFIYHGRWDGVTGSVPYTHSLNLYNAVLDANPDANVFLNLPAKDQRPDGPKQAVNQQAASSQFHT